MEEAGLPNVDLGINGFLETMDETVLNLGEEISSLMNNFLMEDGAQIMSLTALAATTFTLALQV